MYYTLFVCHDNCDHDIMTSYNSDIKKIILCYLKTRFCLDHHFSFRENLNKIYKASRISNRCSINDAWLWYYNNWEGFRKYTQSAKFNINEPLLEIWTEKDNKMYKVDVSDSSWRI